MEANPRVEGRMAAEANRIITKIARKLKNILKNICPKWLAVRLLEIKCGLRNFYKYGSFDIFKTISIETITACNRRCSYCPNSKFDRGLLKNTKKMEPALFHKIIDELQELGWEGEILPHSYGEPLLDDRLFYLVKYAKGKLPKSTIALYTNGDLLTIDLYKELVKAGVEIFIVTQHSQEVPTNIKEVLDYRKKVQHENIFFSYCKLETLFNRGGLIEIKDPGKITTCEVPSRDIVIDYAGNVIFCCNDYLGTVKLGNVNSKRLMAIWKKPYYKKLRRWARKGVFKLEICKRCAWGRPISQDLPAN